MRLHAVISSYLMALCAVTILWSCSATRYVPQGSYLLRRNKIEMVEMKGRTMKVDRASRVTTSQLSPFVQQRPNNRLLGMGIYLGFYNMTDTSKNSGWHRFWRNKLGEAPVIYDSLKTQRTDSLMKIYLGSRGYLHARVTDSVIYRRSKASVTYVVSENGPYIISDITYNIEDPFVAKVLRGDSLRSLIKRGQVFDRQILEREREMVTDRLQNLGFWAFNKGYITYTADTIKRNGQVHLTMNLRRRTVSVAADGVPKYENHPIYRISKITVESDYDPTKSPEQLAAMPWDTLMYNGLEITYLDRLALRENILAGAVRLSPNELYDRSSVQRTYSNIQGLQYSANILFTELPYDTAAPVQVTLVNEDGSGVSTNERALGCLIQCTPNIRQDYTAEAEVSTTADYYSIALTLGYQNRNLFRGAENFTVSFRGAYEFMKNQGGRNSYEFGANMGLDIPRFLMPIRADLLTKFSRQTTKLSLSFSTQRRPDYDRTVFGATFGYGWTLRNGASFVINPADINFVSVPRVNQDFLNGIDNPYLRNSYTSQIIAGLSAAYMYRTNPNVKLSGTTLRLTGDVNGNLIGALARAFGGPTHDDTESYYRILGIRYAQYARLNLDLSGRINMDRGTQLAWRFFAGGGLAYGNSKTLPFERLYFAGGSNSMRGWQVRTLGPGSSPPDSKSTFPNQLGDFRLEANIEYRFRVVGNFNMALFLDAGNIWMNSVGAAANQRFKFNSFYKQVALNTGLGFRYDFGFVLLRLDWGIKVHDPNVPQPEGWNSGYSIDRTALHFAIGLPF